MPWLAKIRLRVFAVLVALTIGVITVVGALSVPVLPAISVALVAAVTVVNTITAKLTATTCAGCGQDLSTTPSSAYGITCTNCGTINHPYTNTRYAKITTNPDNDPVADPDDDTRTV